MLRYKFGWNWPHASKEDCEFYATLRSSVKMEHTFLKSLIVQVFTNSIIYVNRQINVILTIRIWFVSVLHFVRINDYKIIGFLKEEKSEQKKKEKKRRMHAENDVDLANGYVNSVLSCVKYWTSRTKMMEGRRKVLDCVENMDHHCI